VAIAFFLPKISEYASPDYINIYWYILIVGSWVIVVTHVLWEAQNKYLLVKIWM